MGIKAHDLQQKPIERAETIPSNWYYSPEVFEFEQESLFASFWQYACHENELPEAGDMHTLEIAGNPLLLGRDKEGRINSFYNVCKHRGGPTAVKKGANAVLRCQYHGWAYLLDGSLRGVPQFRKVDLFDKKDFGLEPMKMDNWEGLLFVSLDDTTQPVDRLLKGIDKIIAPILSQFQLAKQHIIDCNWKLYVDNFLEGYHIPIAIRNRQSFWTTANIRQRCRSGIFAA